MSLSSTYKNIISNKNYELGSINLKYSLFNTPKFTSMKIEIWSDIVCPFCYIGKKRLMQALANFPQRDDVELVWKSYQLDPSIDPEREATPTLTYLATNKGMPLKQVQDMTQHITALGAPLGIVFNWEQALVANTEKAHRLIQYAATQQRADALKEALLKAHFTFGINVNDTESLVALAQAEGLDAQAVREVLNSDQFAYEVKQDIQDGLNLGLKGVPFFVFDNAFGISGAQPLEVFENTLNQAYEASLATAAKEKSNTAQTATEATPAAADSCDMDTGKCQ